MGQEDYATFAGLFARTLSALGEIGERLTADELLEEINAPNIVPAVTALRSILAHVHDHTRRAPR